MERIDQNDKLNETKETKSILDLIEITKGKIKVSKIKQLITDGQDVNRISFHSNFTPLHLAFMYGKLKLSKMLIEEGADIAKKDFLGKTPYFYAKKAGHKGIMDFYIKITNSKISNKIYENFLFDLCEYNHKKPYLHLIYKGAKINIKNKHSKTYLSVACKMQNEKSVKILLKVGANSNSKDLLRDTFLLMNNNDYSVVKLLFKNGAGIKSIESYNYYCKSFLFYALLCNKLEFITLCFKNGVDINEIIDGETLITKACLQCSLEKVIFLLKNGACIDDKQSILNALSKSSCSYNVSLIKDYLKLN